MAPTGSSRQLSARSLVAYWASSPTICSSPHTCLVSSRLPNRCRRLPSWHSRQFTSCRSSICRYETKEFLMKKLINAVENVVREQLQGMALAHPDLLKVHLDPYYVSRADAPVKGKVALVSG